MRLLSLATIALLSASTLALAATVPSVESATVTCQDSSTCRSETIDGRLYRVIETPRMVVRVSLSTEGDYTRADVSISNNSVAQLNVLPSEFRMDVISPRPHTLDYVEPASLRSASLSSVSPTPRLTRSSRRNLRSPLGAQVGPQDLQPASSSALTLLPPKPQPDLVPTSLLPEGALEGKVFFTRDPRARAVTLVLPLAGAVFAFPFQLQ